MRKYIGLIIAVLFFTACEDALDITPKGKTTLDNVLDLEYLLNQEYDLWTSPHSDISIICNEAYDMVTSVPVIMDQPNTLNYAYTAYDESVDRATLAQEDNRYNAIYKYINYMNILIDKMPAAKGDESKKPSLIAEAKVMRAYLHWLAVNIYAQQYDDAMAESLGGIAYVTDIDATKTKEKLTLEETYNKILEDCSDEVIADLPEDDGDNVTRGDKAWGNAVRARVLLQMKHYEEAIPYAEEALRRNGIIEDRSVIKSTMMWNLLQSAANNYVYIRPTTRISPTMVILSKESSALFEVGDYVKDYDLMGGWNSMMGEMFSGVSGSLMYMGFSASGNVYGLTSDRMYYTLAECYIRTGEIKKGLELVDKVRQYRVENYSPFVEQFNNDADMTEVEAMALLQKAKWIECVGTFENFFDCKRWNTEQDYKKTITKNLEPYGTFSIAPDSPLWVLPFPANVVRHNETLTQNY